MPLTCNKPTQLLDDIKTPTVAELHHSKFLQDAKTAEAGGRDLREQGRDDDEENAKRSEIPQPRNEPEKQRPPTIEIPKPSTGGGGAHTGSRCQGSKSANKINGNRWTSSGEAPREGERVRQAMSLRQSPKRESLMETLSRQTAERKISGIQMYMRKRVHVHLYLCRCFYVSACACGWIYLLFMGILPSDRFLLLLTLLLWTGSCQGRVDAERRFTDGTFAVGDEKFAGTRHLKTHTGVIHAKPWVGPLDTPKTKNAKKTSASSASMSASKVRQGSHAEHSRSAGGSRSDARVLNEDARLLNEDAYRYLKQDGTDLVYLFECW